MKSDIKFECNISNESVNFLDVTVKKFESTLITIVYNKPTDAHQYLHKTSNHPNHVKSNIPKGQFIRARRICTRKEDYMTLTNKMITHFMNHGYDTKKLKKTQTEVGNIDRNTLFQDRKRSTDDRNVVFVTDWHPNFSRLPSILGENHHLLENDPNLNQIFKSVPIVSFRRTATIRSKLTRNDILTPTKRTTEKTKPCSKCKLCPNIEETSVIKQGNKTIKLRDRGGNCNNRGVTYTATCTKHDKIYVSHTGDQLSDRFSKHRHEIPKRPENSELMKHFHGSHNIKTDMKIFILQSNVPSLQERERLEDKWIQASIPSASLPKY